MSVSTHTIPTAGRRNRRNRVQQIVRADYRAGISGGPARLEGRAILTRGLCAGLMVLAGCGGAAIENELHQDTVHGTDSIELQNADQRHTLARASNGLSVPAALDDVAGGPPLDSTETFLADESQGPHSIPVRSPQTSSSVHRPPDRRQRHDDSKLALGGIHSYESRRLKLYTDIDPAVARTLPPLIDAAYNDWEAYFGPLPPNPEGTDYQITGYLMKDKDLFRSAGLLPDDLPPFVNGRHRGAEFWMHEQEHAYYRQHLVIHESTHCFMTSMPGVEAPLWYMEGMAELFGTHAEDKDGFVRFRVMPHDKEHFAGLGRITLIQQELQAGRGLSPSQIGDLSPDEYLKTEAYAWSWGVCKFLDSHPRYRDRFRELGRRCVSGAGFLPSFEELFLHDLSDIAVEWTVFVTDIAHSYDFERAAIDFRTGEPLTPEAPPRAAGISADRGWQSSGVKVEQGARYEITASGRFAVGREPKLWVCEPQGISFWYVHGRPLGMLLGAIRSVEQEDSDRGVVLDVIPIGRQHQLTALRTGTLYLRVNDFSNRLSDNSGTVHVEIRGISGHAGAEPDAR